MKKCRHFAPVSDKLTELDAHGDLVDTKTVDGFHKIDIIGTSDKIGKVTRYVTDGFRLDRIRLKRGTPQ